MNALSRNFSWIIEYSPNVKQNKYKTNTYMLRKGEREPVGQGVKLGAKNSSGVMGQLPPAPSQVLQSHPLQRWKHTTLGASPSGAAFTNSAKPQTL